MGGGGIEDGLSGPLFITSSTFSGSDSSAELFPYLHQGDCSSRRDLDHYCHGSGRASSPLSRVLQSICGSESFGAWKPMIDLSHHNDFVRQTRFKMESNQSVLRSVQKSDWMVSIDLKDAYLQVPIHPDSHKFLRFVVDVTVYQFRALCFGLSTAPQVFTRFMVRVSVMLHSLGVRMLRYVNDWLILASSQSECRRGTECSNCVKFSALS